MKVEDFELQPLRIPYGWRVIHNMFFDVDPDPNLKIEGYQESCWLLFDEELLLLEHDKYEFIIDLGWNPSHSPDTGSYLLWVYQKGKSDTMVQYRTKDRAKITEKINYKGSMNSAMIPSLC